jgi:hypothetical protein
MQAFVVTLVRRRKKVSAVVVVKPCDVFTTRVFVKRVIWIVATTRCIWSFLTVASCAHGAV